MTHKNNSLWRFLFSLMPGAGEMYMGFLKAGTSLMALFIFIIFAATLLGFGELIVIDIIVWFYSFFHVHNLAALSDEEFYAVEDNYLFSIGSLSLKKKDFSENNRKILATVLIVMGFFMTWRGILYILSEFLPWELYSYILNLTDNLPRIIMGIAIIALGIVMIQGKKEELNTEEPKEELHGEQK